MREIKYKAFHKASKKFQEIISINFRAKQVLFEFELGWQDFENVELIEYSGYDDFMKVPVSEGDIRKGNHQDNFIIESINGGLQMYNARYYGQPHNELIAEATCNPQTKSWLQNSEIIGNLYEHPHLFTPSPKEDKEK